MGTINKTLGGDRLGSGNRMKVSMHGYGRSSHNLSRAWRSSMAPGTLVPCFVEPILAGDTWDIDLNTMIRTLPTNGPLFGKFKLQVDFFKTDIRLYNRMLHNNLTKVGLDMKKVLLPQIFVIGANIAGTTEYRENPNTVNISTDSLLNYLKIRGLGTSNNPTYTGTIGRSFNAVPLLAYWEIYLNYYANKQEEVGYVITSNVTNSAKGEINTAWYYGKGAQGGRANLLSTQNQTIDVSIGDTIRMTGSNLSPTNITIRANRKTGTPTPSGRVSTVYNFEITENTGTTVSFLVTARTDIRQMIAVDQVPIAGIDPNVPIVVPTSLRLEKFKLTNIEDIRNKIFEQPNTSPFALGPNEEQPYAASLGIWIKEAAERERSASAFPMAGLGIKTYNSDRFNNWIKTEWIDGANGIAALTAVPIVDGKFTIDSLNLLQKVYNLMNRIALSGGTYQDWLETTTGLNLTYNPEIPVFVGGMNATIEFNEVISTAETETVNVSNPLGSLAGRGYQDNQSNGKIIVKAKEHGFLIGIVSITPEIDYSQGNGWFNNLTNMDQFHKPELSQIGYQELITEEMAAWDTKIDEDNKVTYKSAGKQTAWIQYQTAVNETYGKFAQRESEMFMTLNRQYEYDNVTGNIKDLTTYIDPVKYNYAFAQADLSAQNFWVQIGFKATARRIMSAKAIPNL